FQDAVQICRRLGVSYLWIDSLCIIQDDREDWLEQAKQMGDIYENAITTIAATSSSRSSQGIFGTTERRFMAEEMEGYDGIYIRQQPPHWPSNGVSTLDNSSDWPLLQRGWTYQEIRLSPRTVHFCTQEVIWECAATRKSESGTDDQDFGADFEAGDYHEDIHCGYIPYSVLEQNDLRGLWWRTVLEYSGRNLTYESDKMPALAALAQRMLHLRGNDRYVAGLWEQTLVQDLTWMKNKPAKGT
ncbi:hypothetical protein BDW02DRAFT_484805, partial [Decorospora gaudefroyi]